MDSLSKQIALMISQYLPPEALAAWSATSHHWRDVFNRDECWRRYCDPSLVDHLLNTHCIVEPGFVNPEEAGSGLRPLCQWRLHYMRQNHLWNNWRSRRYSERQIRFEAKEYYLPFPGMSQDSNKKVAMAIFYNEDFLVGHFNSRIEMWDLRGEAVLYVENPCFIFPNLKVLALYIYKDKLVVVQRVVVLVFQISLTSRTWPVLHTFFMQQKENCSLEEAKLIVRENVSIDDLFDGIMLEDLFVGIKSCGSDKMHIWNIDSGLKVIEAKYEDEQQWCFYKVSSGVLTRNVVVTMLNRAHHWSKFLMRKFEELGTNSSPTNEQSCNSFSRLMIYSLTELSFLSFSFNSEDDSYPDAMINEKFVTINTKNSCLVYNYQTQDLLAKLPKYTCAQILKETIMICDGHSLKQMVFSTKEVKHLLESDSKIKSLDVISDKYTALLVSTRQGRYKVHKIRMLRSGSQDIWEIEIPLRQLLPTFIPLSGYISFGSTKQVVHKLEINKTFTKMVYKCGSPLQVYHFW